MGGECFYTESSMDVMMMRETEIHTDTAIHGTVVARKSPPAH